ncbi:MAG TPA: lipid A biosynthesis lauroyl acyltransferase [Gammaproteobacteria bacterium]|nr:lipid A biosynthesis lauroyl acyltransferase [Gammaproteobacteria bacterium]
MVAPIPTGADKPKGAPVGAAAANSEDIPRGPVAKQAAPEPATFARFAAPRFWPMWLLVFWMRFIAALPLSWSLFIHRAVGPVLYRVAKRQRRTALRNLELCFPELAPREVEALAKKHFASIGLWFAECSMAWFASPSRVDALFRITGAEHLHSALAKGKGVILYTGHFTTLEICGRPFKRLVPYFAAMFSHRSNALLEAVQARGRAGLAHETIPSDNVRVMLRSLKNNAVVWYAPDQSYSFGKLVPFFHELAMTNVATSKLARLSGAVVVPFSYRRVDAEARYELEFHPPLEDFPTDDPVGDTARLVKVLEGFIRAAPEQYQWIHKKFKGRPPELPDLYARGSR